MNSVRRLGKNIILYMSMQVISYVLQFIFVIAIVRYLGADLFGIVSLALALNCIFGMFADLGIRQVTTREIARDKSLVESYMGNILSMKMFLSLAAFGALCLFTLVMRYPPQTRFIVCVMGSSVVFDSFSLMFYGLFQGHERMEYESTALAVKSALLCIAAFFVITKKLPVDALAVLYAFISAAVMALNFMISRFNFYTPHLLAQLTICKRIFREALPFGALGLFTALNQWVGTVILSKSGGNISVGLYNAAYRIFFVLLLVPVSFDMAIFPVMSRLFVQSRESVISLVERYFKYLVFICFPVAVFIFFLSKSIVMLFFGESFLGAALPLQILMGSMVLIFMGTPFSSVLSSINKQVHLAAVIGFSAVFNVVLSFVLIPPFGHTGAAWVSLISNLPIVVGVFLVVKISGYSPRMAKIIVPMVKALCASGVMGICLFFLRGYAFFFSITAGVFVYILCLYLMRVFDEQDYILLKLLLKDKDDLLA